MTVIHGVTAKELSNSAIPITTASISTIGLVAYADDADPIAFPMNTPVLVTSMTRALSSAGYGGTLRRALEAIQPITNPTMVVIRCPSGSKSDVIGDVVNGTRTGIQALLSAKSKLGVTPKILVAPQLENPDVDQALIAVAKKLRGYVYSTPRDDSGALLATLADVQAYRDTLGDREIELIWPEFTSGNVLQATQVAGGAYRIVSTQAITTNDAIPQVYSFPAFYIAQSGTVAVTGNDRQPNWLTTNWQVSPEGFTGSTPQAVIDAINAKLTAHGALARLTTVGDSTNFIEIVSATEFFYDANDYDGAPLGAYFTPLGNAPMDDDALAPGASATPVYASGKLPTTAVAAALRAKIDNDTGWHKSLSNVVVTGPTGISQDVTWDLEDQNTDATFLNNHQVTTLIQHLGFRFWGNRNCSSDPQYAFEVYTRTAQVLLDTIINGVFPYVDQPLTGMLAKDIIDSISAELRQLVKERKLIGASCWYDPDSNSTDMLSQGQFWIDYDYTPVPPLEQLGLNQRITTRYLVNFAQMIAQAA